MGEKGRGAPAPGGGGGGWGGGGGLAVWIYKPAVGDKKSVGHSRNDHILTLISILVLHASIP